MIGEFKQEIEEYKQRMRERGIKVLDDKIRVCAKKADDIPKPPIQLALPYKKTEVGFKPTIVDAETDINMCPINQDIVDTDLEKLCQVFNFFQRRVMSLRFRGDDDLCADLFIHMAKKSEEFKNIIINLAEKHNNKWLKTKIESYNNLQIK